MLNGYGTKSLRACKRSARLGAGAVLLALAAGCARPPAGPPSPPLPSPPPHHPTTSPPSSFPVPIYPCEQITEPLTIDGRLNEPAWEKAESTGPFVNWDGTEPADETTAKMLWDRENLYLAFGCEDHDLRGHKRHHDDNLWEENEVVEWFIDAAGDGGAYLEFEVNPLNTVVDLLLPGVGVPGPLAARKAWDSRGLRTAVTLEGTPNDGQPDQGWTVEAALPLADVIDAPHTPPQAGDVWRLNLYRVDQIGEEVQFYAWSPTLTPRPNFHVPERFGKVMFKHQR